MLDLLRGGALVADVDTGFPEEFEETGLAEMMLAGKLVAWTGLPRRRRLARQWCLHRGAGRTCSPGDGVSTERMAPVGQVVGRAPSVAYRRQTRAALFRATSRELHQHMIVIVINTPATGV